MSVKFSVVEGINADTNAKWSVSSRLDISSATEVVKELSVNTNHLMCYSDLQFVFQMGWHQRMVEVMKMYIFTQSKLIVHQVNI